MEREWIDNEKEIKDLISNFFKHLYQLEPLEEMEHTLNVISPIISKVDNTLLLSPIKEEEVQESVFQLGVVKALSLDGYFGIFLSKILEHC